MGIFGFGLAFLLNLYDGRDERDWRDWRSWEE